MKSRLIIAFIGISSFAINNLISQQNFQVEISSDSILMENYFIVNFTAENLEGNFEAPDFSNFHIISGPNTSSSFQLINGESKRTSSYSYHLKPKEEGAHLIDSAFFITKDGQTLETVAQEITVYPNPEGIIIHPKSESKLDRFDFDFPFEGMSPRKSNKDKRPSDNNKSDRKLKRI